MTVSRAPSLSGLRGCTWRKGTKIPTCGVTERRPSSWPGHLGLGTKWVLSEAGSRAPGMNLRHKCTQLESPWPCDLCGAGHGLPPSLLPWTLSQLGMSPGLTPPSSPDTYSALGH